LSETAILIKSLFTSPSLTGLSASSSFKSRDPCLIFYFGDENIHDCDDDCGSAEKTNSSSLGRRDKLAAKCL
jgi:hypothetical protein